MTRRLHKFKQHEFPGIPSKTIEKLNKTIDSINANTNVTVTGTSRVSQTSLGTTFYIDAGKDQITLSIYKISSLDDPYIYNAKRQLWDDTAELFRDDSFFHNSLNPTNQIVTPTVQIYNIVEANNTGGIPNHSLVAGDILVAMKAIRTTGSGLTTVKDQILMGWSPEYAWWHE